jgi:hypothetical protein
VASFAMLVRHMPTFPAEKEVSHSLWQVYDHLLTFGQEIELIWPTPWSLGKFLFFTTKYLALVDGAILTYCAWFTFWCFQVRFTNHIQQ